MSKIEKSIGDTELQGPPQLTSDPETTEGPSQSVPLLQPLGNASSHYKSHLCDSDQNLAAHSLKPKTPMALCPDELNPPAVQKIVVEHIEKSEDKATHAHSSLRLRAFSGKIHRPYSEVDFEPGIPMLS